MKSNKYTDVPFLAAEICDGYLWFSNINYNGLFRMRLQDGYVEFVTFFPEEKLEQTFLHLKCLLVDRKLFFIPAVGNQRLQIYNIDHGNMRSLTLFSDPCAIVAAAYVSDALYFDDKIWLFPQFIDVPLMSVDVNTLQKREYPSFQEQYRMYIQEGNKRIFPARWKICNNREKCYFGINGTGYLMSWDLKQEKLSLVYDTSSRILSVHNTKNHLWITFVHQKEVMKMDLDGKNATKYDLTFKQMETETAGECFALEDDVVYIAQNNPYIVKLNKECGEFDTLLALPSDFSMLKVHYLNNRFFSTQIWCKDELWLLPNAGNGILVLSPKNLKIRWIPVRISEQEYKKEWYQELNQCRFKTFQKNGNTETERISLNLKEYIQVINNSK